MSAARFIGSAALVLGALVHVPLVALAQKDTAIEDVIASIEAVKPAGGSDEWDDAVRPILLNAFDQDSSGSIDRATEIELVPCTVLLALDRLVKPYDNNRSGLTWTYGFSPDTKNKTFSWQGNRLGIDVKLRSTAYGRMRSCQLPTK